MDTIPGVKKDGGDYFNIFINRPQWNSPPPLDLVTCEGYYRGDGKRQ